MMGDLLHASDFVVLMEVYQAAYGPIHCLHDFAHKQDSQLNSSVLITVWRAVIEVWHDSQLNSSAFSHCSVWRVAIGKVYLCYGSINVWEWCGKCHVTWHTVQPVIFTKF